MAKKKVRAGRAMTRGLLVIYWPFLVMLVGANYYLQTDVSQTQMVMVGGIAVLLAWLWWAFAVPRWRMWLLENVDDVVVAYKTAVKNGLMWRPGHVFERTEIKSNLQGVKEREMEFKLFMEDFIVEAAATLSREGITHSWLVPELRKLLKDFNSKKPLEALTARKDKVHVEIKETIPRLNSSWKWVRWILEDYVRRMVKEAEG